MLRAVDRVCPLLGLAGDRRTAVDGVDGAHRCHADEPPTPLDRNLQAQLCLTPAHERCERYLQYLTRTGTMTPGRSTLADGLISTRMLLAPQPPWRGLAGTARRPRPVPLVATGGAVVLLGVAGVALASGLLGREPGGIAMSASPIPTDGPTSLQTPSLAPTPSATATPYPRRFRPRLRHRRRRQRPSHPRRYRRPSRLRPTSWSPATISPSSPTDSGRRSRRSWRPTGSRIRTSSPSGRS